MSFLIILSEVIIIRRLMKLIALQKENVFFFYDIWNFLLIIVLKQYLTHFFQYKKLISNLNKNHNHVISSNCL